jgi:DNA-binding Xre family transcriptional regulator
MARVIAVNQALRDAVTRAIDREGLGVTSPEIGASVETVRKLLNGQQERFSIAVIAKLCISLGITPGEVTAMDLSPVAREMERQAPNEYNEALLGTMRRKGGVP